MAASDGFIVRSLERVRTALDEPSVNRKWTDRQIIEWLESAYAHVLGEINRNTQSPIVASYVITCGDSTTEQTYTMPPTVGAILALELLTSDNVMQGFLRPAHRLSAAGWHYQIEGHQLRIAANAVQSGSRIRIVYTPTGTARLHYGSPESISEDGLTVVLAASPTAGSLDRRPNAYAGSVFRILDSDAPLIVQERVISGYDPATRTATLSSAMSPVPTGDTTPIVYEIAPALDSTLDLCIAMYAAWGILGLEGQYERQRVVERTLAPMLRSIRLNAAQLDSYAGMHFASDTVLADCD